MTPRWVCELLDRHGVHYEQLHRPEGFTELDLAAPEHGARPCAAEVLVAVADGRLIELVFPVNHWADLERVRELLQCHEVRPATQEELQQSYPGCKPGAVPPLHRSPSSDVIVDRWVDINSDIVFLAGTDHDAIRMPIREWFEMVNPRLASFSQPVESPAATGS
ncbi:MAG: hypothetical protein HY000_40325 [Planctomycetes bacterium]|nr:hypothetical protein [Planctomycetota bacterium]